jgi:hypothetical protein
MTSPTIAHIPRFCVPAPVNIVELAGDVPHDRITGEWVGLVIARAEVLMSLTSILVGESLHFTWLERTPWRWG